MYDCGKWFRWVSYSKGRESIIERTVRFAHDFEVFQCFGTRRNKFRRLVKPLPIVTPQVERPEVDNPRKLSQDVGRLRHPSGKVELKHPS